MRESLNEPVSVVWYYNATHRRHVPQLLSWGGKQYRLGKIDFYHKTRRGDTILHHFSIADRDGQAYFKLAFDGDSLHWTIEEFMYAGDVTLVYGEAA